MTANRVRPPRDGRGWQASTIYGWAARGSGILRNTLYAGRLTWNKSKMLKDPATGKRVSRKNPTEEHETYAVPDLQIVDHALWEFVQAKIKPKYDSPEDVGRQRRPVRPLSGLLRCGGCGGGMSTRGKDRSGRVRVCCTRHHQSRTCPNTKTWYLDVIEEKVLGLLRKELDRPELLQHYIDEYNKTRLDLQSESIKRRAGLSRAIKNADEEIGRLINFISKGIGDQERLAETYASKCSELQALRDELANEPPEVNLVALHSRAVDGYRKDLQQLIPIMGSNATGETNEYAVILRRLIDTVTVSENANGQMEISIAGHLRALVDAPELMPEISGGPMVAEEGLEPPTRGL
ncbi:recombinase family protein [Paracoccus sp. SCN 68-21]|uniref:recombinase family protein n=1 Tax=Paracoccus TaxID=265 RepID=UPI0033900FEE